MLRMRNFDSSFEIIDTKAWGILSKNGTWTASFGALQAGVSYESTRSMMQQQRRICNLLAELRHGIQGSQYDTVPDESVRRTPRHR